MFFLTAKVHIIMICPKHLSTKYPLSFDQIQEKSCTFARDMKTKHVQYETSGTCSKMIDVTADENNVIQQVFFLGGCNGNLQGISQLVRGQRIDDVIPKINGIRCGTKGTSCPDQLCRALEQLRNAPLED